MIAPVPVHCFSITYFCNNLMYLNNWIQDLPFSLDTLKDIPRLVHSNAWFTSIDDKSAFDNVKLNSSSYDLVAFQWGGYFFRYKTIPFGLESSSFLLPDFKFTTCHVHSEAFFYSDIFVYR